MTLTGDPHTAAQINAMLVRAGVGVTRLEPVRHIHGSTLPEQVAEIEGVAPATIVLFIAVGQPFRGKGKRGVEQAQLPFLSPGSDHRL